METSGNGYWWSSCTLLAPRDYFCSCCGPASPRRRILAMMALLTANVIADLWVAQMISAGRVRGDWELALAFSVVPAIGIVYALALLRTAR